MLAADRPERVPVRGGGIVPVGGDGEVAPGGVGLGPGSAPRSRKRTL